jgi:hypothetical protein
MRMLLLCYDIWWVWKKKKIDCIIARKGFELFFFLCHMKWCAMVPELTGRGSHLAHSSTLSFIEWCPYPKCGSTCGHGSRVGINVSQPLHTECILCRPFKRLKEKNNVYDMWMFYLHLLYCIDLLSIWLAICFYVLKQPVWCRWWFYWPRKLGSEAFT